MGLLHLLSSERSCAEERLFQNSAWLHLSLRALGECLCLRQVLNQAPLVLSIMCCGLGGCQVCVLLFLQGAVEDWWQPRSSIPTWIWSSNALSLCNTLFCCRLLLFSFPPPHPGWYRILPAVLNTSTSVLCWHLRICSDPQLCQCCHAAKNSHLLVLQFPCFSPQDWTSYVVDVDNASSLYSNCWVKSGGVFFSFFFLLF